MPLYRFGEISVDTDRIEVVGPDGVRDVEPQVFDVLQYLIEQPARLVTKEELLDNVWGNRFVSESALTTRIKQARRALGDDGRTQWAIKTVHGRGYRFVAEPDDPATQGLGHPHPVGQGPVDQKQAAGGAGTNGGPPIALPDELQADTRQLFVGRDQELQRSLDVLSGASADGSFGWVWLLGEPGIGKTRLAAEIARQQQQLGHRVMFGRNNEDLKVPHQPFLEAIRSILDGLDEAERASHLAATAPELAPLLPGIVAPSPLAPDGRPIDDETQRYRLFEAVAEWLIEQAGLSPLVMVIDDAHWAADSTLQLLSHLHRRPEGSRISFVVTARDTAPDSSPKVVDLVAASQGETHSAVIRLLGLTNDDAVRFVGDAVDLDDVMRQTAGNPLLLQAVNYEDGSVDVKGAVHRRLASLSPAVQESLQTASILGLEFELKVAAAATGRDELDLLDDLEEAIAARLLDDIGVDRFRFTHALIRSSLRDDLTSTRRARMHRRTAEAIDAVFGHDAEHIPALAFHTAAAAEADSSLRPLAVERLAAAAQQSMGQFSFDEAAAFFNRALHLANPDDVERYAQLMLHKGIAETRAGKSMTAARTFDGAVAAARMGEDPGLLIEAALRFEDATWRPGLSGARALEHLGEASETLERHAAESESPLENEPELRARLAIGRLRALALSGQADRAEEEFALANDLARRLKSANLEASALNVYLSQIRFFHGLHDTRRFVDRLAELQPDIDDGDIALHAVHVRSLHATLEGRSGDARQLAGLMTRLQAQSRSKFWRFIRTNQEAMEAFYLGDLEAAERLAEECLTLAEDLPEEDGSGTYGLRMFMIRREQGRLNSIAPLVRHILTRGDISGVWTPGLALLLVETGSPAEAAELLDDIKAASFDLPLDAMWSTVMVFLVEAMVQLEDAESCALLRDRFEPLTRSNVTTGSGLLSFGSADRYLGMLSLIVGELNTAEAYLGAALEADSAGESVLWSNESRLWLSRVRSAQGHGAEAQAMRAVVAEQAGGAGLIRLQRLAGD